MKIVTLVTGGIRSGKSRYALELAEKWNAEHKSFLATAEPLDEEMRVRIARHQEERQGTLATVEEPLYLSRAIAQAQDKTDLVLIDCLTMWVNNLLYYFSDQPELVKREIQSFVGVVGEKRTNMILVTNEIGLGVVPENEVTRRFTEQLGHLNQEIARMCDKVIFMVSGIPQVLKGEMLDARLDSTL